MIILKITKNLVFNISIEDTILEKSQRESNWHPPRILRVNKPTCKELYLISVDANTVKPTAQDYFENLVEISQFN